MIDERELFERAAGRFDPPRDAWDRLHDLRDRKRRNQRVAAGILALALVVAGVGAVVSVARNDDRVTPGGDGGGLVVQQPSGTEGPCFAEDPCWDHDVFVMRVDGSGQMRLGFDAARDIASSWSADGGRIAFLHAEGVEGGERTDLDADIYTMAADGTDVRGLTDGPAVDVFPAFSPDGTKIAFMSDRAGTFDIYVMNTDGTGVVRLTEFENDGLDDYHPTWSPDGEQIAFVRGEIPPGRPGKLWVIDADGSNGHVLLNEPLVSFPSWSPDGTRIAFDTGPWPDVRLGILELESGTVTDLGVGYAARWSPDSNQLVIAVPDGGIQILEIADPTRRQMVHPTGYAPIWSPDGEWIAFTDVGLTASGG